MPFNKQRASETLSKMTSNMKTSKAGKMNQKQYEAGPSAKTHEKLGESDAEEPCNNDDAQEKDQQLGREERTERPLDERSERSKQQERRNSTFDTFPHIHYVYLLCFTILLVAVAVPVINRIFPCELSASQRDLLKKSIIAEIVGPKLTEHLQPIIQEFDLELSNLYTQIEKIRNIGERIKDLNASLNNAYQEMKQLNSSFEQIKVTVSDFKCSIDATIEDVRRRQTDIEKTVSSFKSHINARIKDARKHLYAVASGTKAVRQRLDKDENRIKRNEDDLDNLDTKLVNLTANVSAIFRKLYLAEKRAMKINENIKETGKTLKNALSDNINLQESVRHLNDTMKDTVIPNLYNKKHFSIAFMILVVLVFILTIKQFHWFQGARGDANQQSASNTKTLQNSSAILKQIPEKPELENALCIISFDYAQKDSHKRLVESAYAPNCRLVQFTVRGHTNLSSLPRSKLYIMCVEFSERHIIIEEQGLGLGDLRLTTYRAINKLGGHIIILYVRDPGSRKLTEGQLFNMNIYCATHQPELVELSSDDRFFSTYNDLSAFQKKTLRDKITKGLV